MPRWCRPLAVVLVVGVLVRLTVVAASSTPLYVPWRDMGIDAVLVAVAVAALLMRWRVERRARAPYAAAWVCYAGGVASFEVGNLIWYLLIQGRDLAPYPSWADAGWLGYYPFVFAGLVVVTFRLRLTLEAVCDGLIVGFAAATVLTATALVSLLALSGTRFAEMAVNIAYPVLDLVLIVWATTLVASRGWALNRLWACLIGGFLAFAVADGLYMYQTAAGTYVNGTWLDAMWTFGVIAPGLAACCPPLQLPPQQVMDRLNLWVPVAGFGTAVVTLAIEALAAGRWQVVVLAIASAVAGVSRHVLAYAGALAERAARQEARTDPLTELLNRRGFEQALQKAFEVGTTTSRDSGGGVYREADSDSDVRGECDNCGSNDGVFSLLVLDLDGFKAVNDTHGHAAGDEILSIVAARLRALVRSEDALARLGGDEFAILTHLDEQAAQALAVRVWGKLNEPYRISTGTAQLGASIGIAVYPHDATGVEQLLHRADLAMYVAKRSGCGWLRYDADAITLGPVNPRPVAITSPPAGESSQRR